jgi:dihydrofolate reductase/thymidylate synthase
MFKIIVAVNNSNGIGLDGTIPWNSPEDLQFFRQITSYSEMMMPNVVIMGSRTRDAIAGFPLKNRYNIILTSKHNPSMTLGAVEDPHYADSFETALKLARTAQSRIFVIGGQKVYETALKHPNLESIYLTRIADDTKCDTHFQFNTQQFRLEKSRQMGTIVFEKYIPRIVGGENGYLQLIKEILDKNTLRETRNAPTVSTFAKNLAFDLSDGKLPVLTTKKIPLRVVFEELMFFIRGQTDNKVLKNKNVKIWTANTTREFMDKYNLQLEEDDLGPMYGFQWRYFGAEYKDSQARYDGKGYDQLKYVLDLLKTDCKSRRIIMTTYNPAQADQGVLYPCHGIVVQFYIGDDGLLECQMYQRSADVFLGLPFNIASYAMLTHFIADYVGVRAGALYICLGDTHIYKSHLDVAREQLTRIPIHYPTIKFDGFSSGRLKTLESIQFDDLQFDYQSHSVLNAVMES